MKSGQIKSIETENPEVPQAEIQNYPAHHVKTCDTVLYLPLPGRATNNH